MVQDRSCDIGYPKLGPTSLCPNYYARHAYRTDEGVTREVVSGDVTFGW